MIQLINGDCLEEMKSIPDKSIDMIFTDPPYFMKYRSNYRKTKYEKILNDDNTNWIRPFFIEANRIIKDDKSILLFCSLDTIPFLYSEAINYFTIKKLLIWVKNNWSSGDLKCDFANRTEYILHLQKGRNKLNGKRDSNVLYFDRTLNKNHPTEKPVPLLSYLIEKLSNENEIILDSFMGSGSTGVACINTDRNFIGIEKDKEYFEIAKKRIEEI